MKIANLISKSDRKPLLAIVFASLFINIYTFTSLSHLFIHIFNLELLSKFNELTNYDDYLFLMRFLLYFITSTISGITIYYFTKITLSSQKLHDLRIKLAIAITILTTISILTHISIFDIQGTDLLITKKEYYFRRTMWYIGRTLSISLIAIYIANIHHKTAQIIKNEIQINNLKIENLKTKFQQLKLKISPYLITNTFIIIEENYNRDKKLCQKILLSFSVILRKSLTSENTTKLKDELDLLLHYITIINKKYPIITYKINVCELDAENLNIPNFTLIILLENTLKNVIYDQFCFIQLDCEKENLNFSINSNNLEIINNIKYYNYIEILNERSIFLLNKELKFEINTSRIDLHIPLSKNNESCNL